MARPAVAIAALALAIVSPVLAKRDGEEGSDEETDMYAKTGEGSNATYRFSFDAATSQVGNAVGKLMVTFPSGGSLTNTGFFQGGQTPWRAGALLGKADEYVWPIPPSRDDGGFVFDHGVSDIVFGDVNAQDTFRPEFDENIYSDPRATFNRPQDALRIQLAEESKESSLEFGSWMPDGYYQKGPPEKFRYNPKLKLKDPSADFKRVGMATSDMVSAVLERPSIMDIDALFTATPVLPQYVRSSREVDADRAYGTRGGGYGGGGGYLQESATEQLGMQQSQAEARAQETTTNLPIQISVQWLTPVLQKFRCVSVGEQYAKSGASPLFIAMGWDTESGLCPPTKDDCLDIDLSLVPVEANAKSKAPIFDKMVWYADPAPLTLKCEGGGAEGKGFGWGGMKKLKGCLAGYGRCAMNAFKDDRSGSEPGDDEVTTIDLACLDDQHDDVGAVVVLATIYAPSGLTWAKVDSAYVRMISGGSTQYVESTGQFFIQGSEAVRSYIRLSGNDLKADPNLQKTGLAVGMLFKQPTGWAFSALLKGMDGTSAKAVVDNGQLKGLMQSLTYPASKAWDQTQEQQQQAAQGSMGEAGFKAKGSEVGLIAHGQLPCIADRNDHAMLKLAKMPSAQLAKVAKTPKYPEGMRKKADMLANDPVKHEATKKLADGYEKMEKATSETERKKIAEEHFGTDTSAATPSTEDTAMAELDDLFDDI